MKVVAIESQKGGVGKTTLAINLGVAAELDGKPAAIIDLDPQVSATRWKELRPDTGPAVVSAQANRLKQILATAEEGGAKLVIIDTAPNSEGSILIAARCADLVLIPCKAGILDLHAIEITSGG
jgi:chromosome partitioning protein